MPPEPVRTKSSWNVSAAQTGRQPHRHRGLVLELAAAGDNRLGDATDQRGRLDHLLHRVEDFHSLVGV